MQKCYEWKPKRYEQKSRFGIPNVCGVQLLYLIKQNYQKTKQFCQKFSSLVCNVVFIWTEKNFYGLLIVSNNLVRSLAGEE